VDRVARESGFKVEGLPADAVDIRAWTNRHLFLPRGARPRTLIELLDRLEDPRWAFVLEKDTLRVVPQPEALRFWTEWWASAPKK